MMAHERAQLNANHMSLGNCSIGLAWLTSHLLIASGSCPSPHLSLGCSEHHPACAACWPGCRDTRAGGAQSGA